MSRVAAIVAAEAWRRGGMGEHGLGAPKIQAFRFFHQNMRANDKNPVEMPQQG